MLSILGALALLGIVAALLAAALHVFIFILEVFAWEGPLARSIFGGTAQEARVHAFYAYNQGFYNLFLAIGAGLGAILLIDSGGEGDEGAAGLALALFATASMLGAALALGLKSSAHRAAALKQGALPLLALVGLVPMLVR